MSRVDMKIVLLGKEFGGKTSLAERYIHDRFLGTVPYQATIGAAFGAKKIDAEGRTLTLGIWDTAGSERYESMSRIYYRGAKAAVVCFDLTDRSSFDRAKYWVNELRKNEEHCRLYLCGTKKDLVEGENKHMRQVDYHMVTDYADEIQAEVFETSSKTSENIRELFFKIAVDYAKDPRNTESSDPERFSLSSPRPSKKCCLQNF